MKSSLAVLCFAVVALVGYSRWRAGRVLPIRLVVLQIRCADSLMERWAGEPEKHAFASIWLDHTAQLQRYRDANRELPAPIPGRIVLYGDSLTDFWTLFAPETFLPGRPAVNRGISGQPTPQLLWRFQRDALDLHPETIVLLAGTNDIVLPGLRVQPSETRQNIARMVEMARRRGIRVVLCLLPPVGFSDPKVQGLFMPQIESLNTWLRSYAAAQRVILVDYFDAMAAPDRSLPAALRVDDKHPNAAGYRIMQRQLEQALNAQP